MLSHSHWLAFSNDKAARLLLINPVISKEKTKYFSKSFNDKLSTLMLSFIKLVIDRGRYNNLQSILEQFNEIFKKEKILFL